jgi:hypothetical protein
MATKRRGEWLEPDELSPEDRQRYDDLGERRRLKWDEYEALMREGGTAYREFAALRDEQNALLDRRKAHRKPVVKRMRSEPWDYVDSTAFTDGAPPDHRWMIESGQSTEDDAS